jgi:Polypeptide deformylase
MRIAKDLPPRELADKDRRPLPFHVIINPQITSTGDDEASFYEGCLSLAGFSAVVGRTRRESRSVEASGWFARILQHEIDHLEARGGIEPPIGVLQTLALPLGHRALLFSHGRCPALLQHSE